MNFEYPNLSPLLIINSLLVFFKHDAITTLNQKLPFLITLRNKLVLTRGLRSFKIKDSLC